MDFLASIAEAFKDDSGIGRIVDEVLKDSKEDSILPEYKQRMNAVACINGILGQVLRVTTTHYADRKNPIVESYLNVLMRDLVRDMLTQLNTVDHINNTTE